MRLALSLSLVIALAGLLDGCTRADCITADCRPLDGSMPDGEIDADARIDADGGPRDAGDGGDTGMCGMWAEVGACPEDGCPAPADVAFDLTVVGSASEPAVRAPESIAFVPGSPRAVAVSSSGNALGELVYGAEGVRFDRVATVATTEPTQYLTSVAVHPTAGWAAVGVADVDCAPGEVVLVDVGESFGAELARIEVGFVPDGVAVSGDGRWLVTADEDQRSNRPCKPDSRHGGTVTVIELGATPEDAAVAQTLAIDHAVDAEPETVAIGSAGTVAVTLQETSELAVFSLGDVPDASATIHSLPSGGEPDGVDVDDARGMAVVGLEHTDDVLTMDLASGEVLDTVDLLVSGDVPDGYNRDLRDADQVHEPEQIKVVSFVGATFALFPLQESHVAMAYRLGDDGRLTLDSTAPTGIEWMDELDGTGRSDIGPEGIAVDPSTGLVLVANEREGSVTLMRSARSRFVACP